MILYVLLSAYLIFGIYICGKSLDKILTKGNAKALLLSVSVIVAWPIMMFVGWYVYHNE